MNFVMPRNMVAVFFAALALIALPAQAGQQADQYKKIVTIEGITEYQLENGVRFLLFPDPSSAAVTVNLTVLVGSRHEGYGETGMAHLLEHMLFKGSKLFPQMDKVLNAHGAKANGTTYLDRTNYYETMPANDANLEFGIKFEADRLVNCFIRREDLAKEMTVVRNEFEQNENSPETVLSQRMTAAAYEWHNYGKTTMGNRSDIERVPIDRLQAFYRKYYQPDNIVLIVSGRFDEKKALAYISRYFGALKRPSRALVEPYTEEPAQDGERVVVLRRVGTVAVVGVVYHIPAAAHPDLAALDVLNEILVAAPSGRLYKALVEAKKATSVNGGAFGWHDPGVMEVMAQVRPGSTPEEVRDIMLRVLENFNARPATKAEVDRARQRLKVQRERALTKSKSIAIELSEWVGAGDWRLLFLHRDRIAKVTPADVDRVAKQYLKRTNRTVGMYLPSIQAARAVIPPAPALADLLANYEGGESLTQGEAFDSTPANIEKRVQRLTLANGLKVALLPKKTRGQAVVGALTLHFGDQKSLFDYTTASEFLGPLMMRGTKKHTRQEIKDALDKLGCSLGAGSRTGSLEFSWQAKHKTVAGLLDLLGEILREPIFPDQEFDILKAEFKQDLQESLTDPPSLATLSLGRQLNPYPKSDIRYQPTMEESLERLAKTTRDQVARLYAEQVGGQYGELVLVGDFEPEAVVMKLQEMVGGWKTGVPYQRIGRTANTKVPGSRKDILTPDKEGAFYVAGLTLPVTDTAPDYPALTMGNHLLGGGTTSRLWERLRQKEGFSYGASSRLYADAQDKYGLFLISAQSNPKVINRVDKAVLEEVERLLKDGVTDKELAAAKQAYLEELKVSRANDARLAGTLRKLLYLGRTYDYYADLEKKIAALSVADVNRALTSYLSIKRLAIVRAGDFKGK